MIFGRATFHSVLWSKKRQFVLSGLVLLLNSMLWAQSNDFVVTSGFNESQSVIGHEATYFIRIMKVNPSEDFSLETPDRPNLPKSSAITFGRFQTSEAYQSSEGNDPIGITLEFEAVSNTEGRIIVPSYMMLYMGKKIMVPAASIDIRSPEFDLENDEVEWMNLKLGDRPMNLKVGQRVNTTLDLAVFKGLRNVTFTNPVPVGSDFSMDTIAPGPTERVMTTGLYRYSIYSWPLTYTAVRSGLVSVSFKVGVNFRIPNDRLEFIRAARSNDPNGSDRISELLQDSREESLTIFSDNLNIGVEPLEGTENPESFYGAIGTFDISISVDQKNLKIGQPTNLTIEIEGEGNFGSFKAPHLKFDNLWRVFEPQESFEDIDFLSYKAKQSYRFVIIPLSSDISEIPPIPYTYFHTGRGEYVTDYSEAIALNLQGESIVEVDDLVPEEQVQEEVNGAEHDLESSIVWDIGPTSFLGAPFFKKMSFYWYQLIGLVGFLFLVLWRARMIRLQRDARFARERQIEIWIKKYLKLAYIASKEEDSEQFYESAFLAFCAVVSTKNDHNVESVTVEGVMSRVRELDLNDTIKRVIGGYLERYEYHRFSGDSPEIPPLVHEYKRLKSIIKKVDVCLHGKGKGGR